MHEPSPRTSRLVVAGSAAAVVLLGGAGFLLGRSTAPTPPLPVQSASPTLAPVAAPKVTETPVAHTLTRADIIAIADAAADATSSGAKLPDAVDDADGSRFEIDLPFGCNGPVPEDSREPFRWRYDTKSSSLRISVAPIEFDPVEWLGSPSSNAGGSSEPSARQEAIEGFWIARPWSSRETCETRTAAVAPLGIDAVTLPGQTLGLAQIFTDEDSKNARRGGKPYESVSRVGENDLKIEQGLRVRLRGRIARFPGGSTAQCRQPVSKDQRPVCLVAVTFDDVAIENPATQATIATWATASLATGK